MKETKKASRARRSEVQWPSLLARLQASGLDIKVLCLDDQISEASFNRWRTRLKRDREDATGERQDAGPAFVDLAPLEPVSTVKPKLDQRFDPGDRLTLHLPRHQCSFRKAKCRLHRMQQETMKEECQ